MLLSAITINYNTPKLTLQSIGTLLAGSGSEAEIILIDNNSKDKVPEKEIKNLGIKLIQNNDNLGFATAVNQGIAVAQGEYILLLNSDLDIEFSAIQEMIAYLKKNKQTAIIGPRLNFPDGRFQPSAGRFPTCLTEFLFLSKLDKVFDHGRLIRRQYSQPTKVDWLSGGCMLFNRALVKKVGTLDGNYFFGIEDIDFCLQARRNNYQTVYYPLSQAIHDQSASFRKNSGAVVAKRVGFDRQGIRRYFKKNFPTSKMCPLFVDWLYAIKILLLKSINR